MWLYSSLQIHSLSLYCFSFCLAYFPVNRLPLVEKFRVYMGITDSRVRTTHIGCVKNGFCLVCSLLDRSFRASPLKVGRFLPFDLSLATMNSYFQKEFLQQFTFENGNPNAYK